MNNKNTYTNVDEYILMFPGDVQAKLQKLRETIRLAAPEAIEKISWQMPTFTLGINLVHFACHKKHIGLYPGESGVAVFKDELNDYHTSKGAIQFPLNQELPYDLITKIVKYRVEENKGWSKKEKN
jgi:uncharacterized protein YdhG (YjbR/CyaY superfamily)